MTASDKKGPSELIIQFSLHRKRVGGLLDQPAVEQERTWLKLAIPDPPLVPHGWDRGIQNLYSFGA